MYVCAAVQAVCQLVDLQNNGLCVWVFLGCCVVDLLLLPLPPPVIQQHVHVLLWLCNLKIDQLCIIELPVLGCCAVGC